MRKHWKKVVIVSSCLVIALGMGALYVLGIFPPLPRVAVPIPPSRYATQQLLITQADAYLKQLHWSVPPSPSITPLDGRMKLGYGINANGIPQATLIIDAHTGQLNLAYAGRGLVHPPVTTGLTPETALCLSRRYARLAGFSLDGLQLAENQAVEHTSDATPRWVISYQRTYHGYPVYGDRADFAMDATTGALRRMSIYLSSPLPPSTVPRLSKGMAERLASCALVLKAGIRPDGITESRLVITRYFDAKSLSDPKSFKEFGPYLAWMVSLTWDDGHDAVVWIDARTCRVVYISRCM